MNTTQFFLINLSRSKNISIEKTSFRHRITKKALQTDGNVYHKNDSIIFMNNYHLTIFRRLLLKLIIHEIITYNLANQLCECPKKEEISSF